MKSTQAGYGFIKSSEEKVDALPGELDKKLKEKTNSSCLRGYPSKADCQKELPLYKGINKCSVCKKGGKI